MLPTAVQKGQCEDAKKTFCSVWHYAVTPQINTKRHLNDFHQPHQSHDDEWDDEATQELPFFCFFVHAGVVIKNCSVAKVGNFGSTEKILCAL